MALSTRKPAPAAAEAEEPDTQEQATATIAATNWESLFIVATSVFLVGAIILVLYEAGAHYGAGPFAR